MEGWWRVSVRALDLGVNGSGTKCEKHCEYINKHFKRSTMREGCIVGFKSNDFIPIVLLSFSASWG